MSDNNPNQIFRPSVKSKSCASQDEVIPSPRNNKVNGSSCTAPSCRLPAARSLTLVVGCAQVLGSRQGWGAV